MTLFIFTQFLDGEVKSFIAENERFEKHVKTTQLKTHWHRSNLEYFFFGPRLGIFVCLFLLRIIYLYIDFIRIH